MESYGKKKAKNVLIVEGELDTQPPMKRGINTLKLIVNNVELLATRLKPVGNARVMSVSTVERNIHMRSAGRGTSRSQIKRRQGLAIIVRRLVTLQPSVVRKQLIVVSIMTQNHYLLVVFMKWMMVLS